MSADSRSTIAPTRRPRVGRYVDRYGNRVSADILADTSIEYRPIVSTDTRQGGSQITHHPERLLGG